ncbi:hypothetical protein JQ625_01435 [Bradyrhizobium diazoefficiens]|nr:hypothetical protein [Bradyrhizobium diazoefficiens]MBR0773484.1 hypothetical protein [Bradyrhizobium diazoefficiens]
MPDGHERPQAEVAGYIDEMCTELREMAHRARLFFLAHLLSMVILQAKRHRQADDLRSEAVHSND